MIDINQKILKARKPQPACPVIKEIASRFSPRYFANQPVADKDLKSILEAARWAPSAHNRQPWFFYLTKKGTKDHQKLFAALNSYNQSWSKTAPVFILACAITHDENGDNPFAFYDLGAAVMSLILQSQSLGYYTRQMALFDKEKVKNYLKLDKNYHPFVIIALGKIGDYRKANKEIIDMELDPRPRKKVIANF
ncbi:MAG: nitroreductase family protein [Microgenomates group bacterium]|nr:nitroreductase family protein [Microgenomates group bacterium]